MSTTTKDLLRAAATVVFAIAATATTVSSAFAADTSHAADAHSASNTNRTNTTAVTSAEQPHALTRAEVQAQVIEARKNGTLLETEADFDVAQTRHHVAK